MVQLVVNGYYEWDESNKAKIRPFLLKSKATEKDQQSLLYLACLYNNAFNEKIGDEFNHFVVLTMPASDNISHIHDRRPVFLDENTKTMWLDPTIDFGLCFKAIISSKAYEGLSFYEVGEIVNSIKYDTDECILPK